MISEFSIFRIQTFTNIMLHASMLPREIDAAAGYRGLQATFRIDSFVQEEQRLLLFKK